MMNKMIKNNRGQISDTMVWFVATFIIITFLVVAIYVASTFGNLKSTGAMFFRGDRLVEKSIFAFLLTHIDDSAEDDSRKVLFQELAEGNERDSLSEQAGQELFDEMYKEKYSVSFEVKNEGLTKSNIFNICDVECAR